MRIRTTTRKHRRSPAVILAVIISFVLLAGLYYSLSPTDRRNETVDVDIPRGTSFLRSVDLLENAGLIKNKYLFYALVIARNAQGNIRAGEYELSTSMSPLDIINKLVKGDIISYRVTIPEDFTVAEIAARLASYKLVDEKAFVSLTGDAKFIASLDIEGRSAEGYLYPDTYLFDKTMSTKEIIKIMVDQFWKKFTHEMHERADELGMTVPQVVTLASIIGKESGFKDEKPLVSAVFHNRLKKRMRLQSDPTAVYDLWSVTKIVKKKHLLRNTAYNTYVINGLPPGPIANPAIDSLQAALYPASVNYLYFVSNNDGSHNFSSSLAAHNRAVLKYQIDRKKE
ncbi:MAG TPA: endolytic transglycosylase MltG [Syntrophales bacterium]